MGRHLVRQWQQDGFVLFWYYSCINNTTKLSKVLFTDPVNATTELDLLFRILSPLSQILLCSTCYSYNSYYFYTIFTRLLYLVTKYSFIMNSFIYKVLIRLEYHSFCLQYLLQFLFRNFLDVLCNLWDMQVSHLFSNYLSSAIRSVSRVIYAFYKLLRVCLWHIH